MKRQAFSSSIAALALGALLAAPAALAQHDHHTVVPADKLAWKPGPPTLPAGAEFAVLHGSPGKPGPFVLRLRFPAGYHVPPHMHTKEEHVTVISGRFGMGTGEKHDRNAAPLLPAGSFVRIPANMPHFAWTDQVTVVQINGEGPFDVVYVNPADDPRRKQQ